MSDVVAVYRFLYQQPGQRFKSSVPGRLMTELAGKLGCTTDLVRTSVLQLETYGLVVCRRSDGALALCRSTPSLERLQLLSAAHQVGYAHLWLWLQHDSSLTQQHVPN